MYFKIYVVGAFKLPEQTCCNPYVTYQFKFDNEIYRSNEKEGINKNPEWNYNKIHCIDVITPGIV